jgi:two-component system, cell cycle sensor histidine kinase and response regulator CckA
VDGHNEPSTTELLDATPDAIVAVRMDGTIALVNSAAEQLFGYCRADLVGQQMEVLVPDAIRDLHPAFRAGYGEDPRPRAMGAGSRLAARRGDGTEFPAEISLSTLGTGPDLLIFAAIRDVTEWRVAAAAQSRLAWIVQSCQDAIVGKTVDGVITSWNPGAARLYGYTEAEMLGQRQSRLFAPDRRAEEARLLSRTASGERIDQYEIVRIRRDGSGITVSLSMSPTLDADGQVVGVASVSRDITELQRAAARFRGLLESAPDAIVGVDADGLIALVNAQTERLFGYHRDELIGQPVELLVPEAIRAVHPGHRARYLADPAPRPMGAGLELTARRRDGTEFPAEISLSTLDLDSGLLVSAAIRDITDRKKAEAKFRGLLEAAPDAIVGVEPDGRIVLVNTQTERLFGYHRDELIGQPVELLVPHGMRAAHPAHRTRYVTDPRQRPMGAGMQLAARRRDGTEFPAEISLSGLDTEDGLLVSAAIRDVSERIEAQSIRERLKGQAEREKLEAQLHQSQRLESLGQLAGGVAHDFNNLLGAIMNYAVFVEEAISTAASEPGAADWGTICRDIEQIRRAAERGANLTHQLLAFGRREIVQTQVLNLNDVVRDIEQLLRRTLGEHIQLATDLAGDLLPVLADSGQLEQVLVNLAVNARDAMRGGGSLTIETSNLDVDDDYAGGRPALKQGWHVRLRVSDTGAGMPKEVVDRAFEPFFTTKPKGEGTGLGLATVYGIVTQASGYAQIYSEPGRGTTFTVLLPVTDRPSAPATPADRRKHAAGGETVLVVEDEDAMREVTRRILGRNGYRVLTAANGADALALVGAGHHIDLLITDVIMPEMQGREVADRVRSCRPDVRVLFMSGYAHPVLASQGSLDAGVVLVDKPFTQHELLDKIAQVLAAPADPAR